ncbi:MAG: transposase [Xenococcaceae cyanobacterium]
MRNLREIVILDGSSNLVYLDESGFEEDVYRLYGWSKRGQKTYGDRNGKRGKRTSLLSNYLDSVLNPFGVDFLSC